MTKIMIVRAFEKWPEYKGEPIDLPISADVDANIQDYSDRTGFYEYDGRQYVPICVCEFDENGELLQAGEPLGYMRA